MLIRTLDAPPDDSHPRLRYVLGQLAKAFRPHRPRPADPDSKRNVFTAMCRKCPWQRDYEDPRIASEASGKHELAAHGSNDVQAGGLVYTVCR